MANTFNEARKNIRFLASTMRGLMDLDEALGDAGSLEKAVAGLKTDLSTLERQRVSALAAIDQANKTASDIVQKAQDQAASIEAQAAETKVEAEARMAEVAGIIADARNQAAALVEAGHRDAAKAAQDADGQLGGLRKDIAAAEAQKAVLEAAIADLNQTKASAQAAVDAIRMKLG